MLVCVSVLTTVMVWLPVQVVALRAVIRYSFLQAAAGISRLRITTNVYTVL